MIAGFLTAGVFMILSIFGGKFSDDSYRAEKTETLITLMMCLLLPPLVWFVCVAFFIGEIVERVMLYWTRWHAGK